MLHNYLEISPNQSDTIEYLIPGKLFVSGEYAILQPQQSAILVAINQYLSCKISGKPTFPCQIDSDITNTQLLITVESSNQVKFNDDSPIWSYVRHAVNVAFQVIEALEQPVKPFQMALESQLNANDGKKYGLGSSGSVTIAAIIAILKFHGITIKHHETLFKLAVLASLKQGSLGSMADLAAISHGGWVYYHRFDNETIQNWLKDNISIEEWLSRPWPELVIEAMTIPENLNLLIGWTGQPASTESFIQILQEKLTTDHHTYYEFCMKMRHLVPQLKEALQANQWDDIQNYMQQNHDRLKKLSTHYQLPILTPQLEQLSLDAQTCQAVGKLSGAGGGDCGIALVDHSSKISDIHALWRSHQIKPLNFNVAEKFIL